MSTTIPTRFSILLPQGSRAHTIEIDYILGSYTISAYTWSAAEGKKLFARTDSRLKNLQKNIFALAGSVVPESLLHLITLQLQQVPL
jgi:hypothetical protein